ncbi:NEAT domain-containing protein [uncultured Clostridium sp.]|uniref:NEAT domain-containing protein n=1 Tax=uncultured Clostridium sp. TaxID=59620 RepID=UPI002671900F|nr:NEAT domain-containing protein [uncultured Clostridium sp.]
MLKKKICQLLAAVMITTTVMGSNVHAVWATERTDVIDVQSFSEKKFQTGTYIVKNSTEYIGDSTSSIGTSMARKALKEDTVITVSEDKTTMTLKFADDMYKMMKNIKATLDGVNLNSVNNEEDKSITFEVPSAEAKVRIDMTITIMGKEVSFLVTNDISTIPTIDNSSDKDEDQNQGNKLADGKYIIANKTLKSGGDSQSGIRNYIDANSIVTVKDGKVTVTMKYNKDGLETVKSTNSITIDGNEVAFVKNEDGSISFNVDSIDKLYTRVKINLTYFNEGLPEVVFPGKLHTVDVDLLHEGELSEYKENDSSTDSGNNGETNKPGNENNSGNAGNEDSNNGGSNTNDSNNNGSNSGTTEVQGTKVYVGKNTVTHENETGLNMARKTLSEDVKVEEVNGKTYVTLTFTSMGSTMMSNHKIYVNGNEVNTTKTVNNEIVSLKFEVGSLKDSIKASAYVSMMGNNVEFGVNILEDTLKLVTDGSANIGGTISDSATSGNTNNNTSSGVSNSNTNNEEIKITKGKLYSIQNSVTHENETGRSMARKYLNSTSKVEEVDGKYYVTLTFTGAAFMQNHEVYVNGKKVNVTKSTSGDTTNVRFVLSSLSDSIKVKTFVVPMSRDVEFGVTLLEDTLTFIKEYTVETLPQTGAPIGAGAVAGLGLMLTTAGTVLVRKRN